MRRRIIPVCVGVVVAVAVFAGLALATGALKPAGKAKTTSYAAHIFTGEAIAPTEVLEIPGIAAVKAVECDDGNTRIEVFNLVPERASEGYWWASEEAET